MLDFAADKIIEFLARTLRDDGTQSAGVRRRACYNEEGNVEVLHERLGAVFGRFPDIDFQIVFVDNASTDRTQELIRGLASRDPRVKAIFNIRNFGAERSGLNGFFSAPGRLDLHGLRSAGSPGTHR